MRKALDKEIDELNQRMLEINDWMYHHPEPGFLEFKAAAMLIEELKKHGFSARHIRQMKYTFHGKSAHAQIPWQGSSALDAVLLLFHAMDMIREHSELQFRFHGIVSDGGAAPNIVPDMASATLWIRHLMDETPVGTMNPRKAREKIESKWKPWITWPRDAHWLREQRWISIIMAV